MNVDGVELTGCKFFSQTVQSLQARTFKGGAKKWQIIKGAAAGAGTGQNQGFDKTGQGQGQGQGNQPGGQRKPEESRDEGGGGGNVHTQGGGTQNKGGQNP